jgi:hypothetical protein
VESQDQKMRNYRQELDRKINDAVYPRKENGDLVS